MKNNSKKHSKVLIIDDEKDICFLISEILRDENFIAESAINSDEAIKKFNDLKPDLIILDVWLGKSKLDGLDLLKQFKKVVQKDMRKYSNIVEGSIRRYVQSKI